MLYKSDKDLLIFFETLYLCEKYSWLFLSLINKTAKIKTNGSFDKILNTFEILKSFYILKFRKY